MDGNKVCDNPPWQPTWAQTLSDDGSPKPWLAQWTAAISPFQVRLSHCLRAERQTMLTGAFIHSIVTKSYECYGVYITGSVGAHAVSLRHGRDNRIHFFDANNGHFVLSDHTKLKAFVDWYWKASGYDTNFLESTCAIVGVRPPI